MTRRSARPRVACLGSVRRGPVLAALACAVLRGALAWYFRGMGQGGALLLSMGGGAVVPGLIGSFEPFAMVLTIAPDLLLCYLLADFMPARLSSDATTLLPRTDSRASWAARSCGRLVLLVCLHEAASCAVVLAMAPQSLHALLFCALLSAALLSALVLLVNLVALRRDAVVGFAVVVGAHVAVLLALSAAPSSLARGLAPWLPSARGVPAWHDAVCALTGLSPEAAASMRPEVSLALLLLLSALALCLIARTVRRADLL